MTRANETPRQMSERRRLDRRRPAFDALSDIERATLLLHRSSTIVRDDPYVCRQRLQILALALQPRGPR